MAEILKLIIWPVLLSGVALAACSDSELYIHATCKISGVRDVPSGITATWTDRCILETMTPREGFNNLYRVMVLLRGAAPIATDLAIPDFIKAQNLITGQVRLTSVLWGNITVSPECPDVRASIARRAPAFEIRPQTVRISMLDVSTLEIRIEERWGDFDGIRPSPDWLARYMDTFPIFSQAK